MYNLTPKFSELCDEKLYPQAIEAVSIQLKTSYCDL